MQKEHKRTFRFGSTKITTHISYDDPVYRGVMWAAEVEGGEFPEHVGHIIIRPDEVRAAKKDHFVEGNCVQTYTGGSTINIYAGSIKQVAETYQVGSKATRVTLHEIGHSERNREIQYGAWLGDKPSIKSEECDAERYVEQAFEIFNKRQAKKRAGQTIRTWKQVLESRLSATKIKD